MVVVNIYRTNYCYIFDKKMVYLFKIIKSNLSITMLETEPNILRIYL